MPKAPRRKFVLLLAEGASDIDVLYRSLNRLIKAKDPSLVLMPLTPPLNGRNHDITAESLEDSSKITGLINKVFINKFLYDNKLQPRDIERVIHVVDLDGAYISAGRIHDGEGRPFYTEDGIYAQDVQWIRQRNKNKQRNIDYLIKQKRIKIYGSASGDDSSSREKKYGIYYFSSNMDHYVHGDANLNHEMKVPMAKEFGKKCNDNKDFFIDFFTQKDDDTNIFGYKESWDFIKKGTRSLEPHTNLHILINEFII